MWNPPGSSSYTTAAWLWRFRKVCFYNRIRTVDLVRHCYVQLISALLLQAPQRWFERVSRREPKELGHCSGQLKAWMSTVEADPELLSRLPILVEAVICHFKCCVEFSFVHRLTCTHSFIEKEFFEIETFNYENKVWKVNDEVINQDRSYRFHLSLLL